MTSPQEILPDSPEEDVTREQIMKAYHASNPPTEHWENFGDSTPEHHGGVWINHIQEYNEWDIVITRPASEVYPDSEKLAYDDPGEQYIRTGQVGASELITEDGEWTEQAQKVIDTLSRAHSAPVGAVVDGKLTKFIATFVESVPHRDYTETATTDDPDIEGVVQESNYQAVLNQYGVTPPDS